MGLFLGSNLVSPAEIVNTGGGASKYSLLERISDDNGNEIGTVSGFFIDNNDVEYAVCVLDSTYRLASAKWMNQEVAVTDLPNYFSQNSAAFGFGSESATFNTQKIVDFCEGSSYTSEAVNHCRSKSFVINGVTYYGQLPNICELCQIYANHYKLGQLDTTESSAADNVKLSIWFGWNSCWSSSQYSSDTAWYVIYGGNVHFENKTNEPPVCPILEIPNVVA